jgi:hypothetical protein
MRSLWILLASTLLACQSQDRSACPSDLAAFGRDEALRAGPASLPKAGCELSGADLDEYLGARNAGLQRLCSGNVAFARGLDNGSFDIGLCPSDTADIARQAHETGSLLRGHIATRDELIDKAEAIEAKLAALPAGDPARRGLEDEAAGLRFDARQRENDIEALRGVAAVEQWR